jgi:hypothetical protein
MVQSLVMDGRDMILRTSRCEEVALFFRLAIRAVDSGGGVCLPLDALRRARQRASEARDAECVQGMLKNAINSVLRRLGFGWWSRTDSICLGAALLCLEDVGSVRLYSAKKWLWIAERRLLFGGNYSRAAMVRLDVVDELDIDIDKVDKVLCELLPA